MLSALQPRGHGYGPVALLSQRLEQVSSGLIHPGAPDLQSGCNTVFLCASCPPVHFTPFWK